MRRHPFRSLAAVAVLAALTAFAVPAFAAHTTKKPKTRVLKVGDFFFVKDSNHSATVHVAPGTVVKWHFVGTEDHNVTVYNGPGKFHSKDMSSGFYTHRVFKQGTYKIECTIHGFKMRLVVGDGSANSNPKPSPTPTPAPAPSPYPPY
jgi:plastocyanin